MLNHSTFHKGGNFSKVKEGVNIQTSTTDAIPNLITEYLSLNYI